MELFMKYILKLYFCLCRHWPNLLSNFSSGSCSSVMLASVANEGSKGLFSDVGEA